jgi:hypothetical protein
VREVNKVKLGNLEAIPSKHTNQMDKIRTKTTKKRRRGELDDEKAEDASNL